LRQGAGVRAIAAILLRAHGHAKHIKTATNLAESVLTAHTKSGAVRSKMGILLSIPLGPSLIDSRRRTVSSAVQLIVLLVCGTAMHSNTCGGGVAVELCFRFLSPKQPFV
jgi:hypothetical protein